MGATLHEENWTLASLPVCLGGLGASDPVVVHPQVAVASFLSSASGRAGLPLSRLDPEILRAVDTLFALLPAMTGPLRSRWLAGDPQALLGDSEIPHVDGAEAVVLGSA